ncbi:MAG: right-handed parallel beta-helix repeat-containing protein [bacterium]|nr:right-handed parallel beta-helix repeat-containing protein [bacterium]
MHLVAETVHFGGDSLTFTWTDESGTEVNFSDHDHTAKSVVWNVPSGEFGFVDITCVVTDLSGDTDQWVEHFEVGVLINSWDVIPPDQNNEIHWGVPEVGSTYIPQYIMSGRITVPAAYTLIIEDSVTIWCSNASKLRVTNLEINGTEDGEVNMKPYADTGDNLVEWGYIEIMQDGVATVTWTNMKKADKGIFVDDSGNATINCSDCSITDCMKGLEVSDSVVTLENCFFIDNNYGAEFDNCILTLNNGTFTGSIDLGLKCADNSTGSCSNITFVDNSGPAVTLIDGSFVEFRDNILWGEGIAFLIGSGYPSTPSIDLRCNYWGNSTVAVINRVEVDRESIATYEFLPQKIDSAADCTP